MKLTKNGVVVIVNDRVHIDAYLSSGWKPLKETTTKKVDTIKIEK